MTARLFTTAVVTWAAGLLLFAAVLRWTGSPRYPPRPPSTSALARSLNAGQPDDRAWRWSVTHARASQGALVVEAVTLDPTEALSNAREIVEPVQSRYSEVLVYLRPPNAKGTLASRRVQWTRTGGYVETRLTGGP
ncbi:MAG TPA: hypothetical protein VIY56_02175 [Vicinamibacterales bacterium]